MSRAQKPLPSGFSRKTTAREVLGSLDLSGKIAIVTGGYTGIGLETTRVLAAAGAAVVVPARDMEKARTALRTVPGVEIHPLDLADPASIDVFCRAFLDSGRALDLLIGNAGIMGTHLAHDPRGYELQFATNHLGHFQLAVQLWPSLKRSGRARVVCLSSGAHRFGGIDFEDPNYHRRRYDKLQAYAQSKTAVALFAVALERRGEPHGISGFSVHPGAVPTEILRNVTLEDLRAMGFRDEHGKPTPEIAALYKTAEQAAATTVWCATDPRLDAHGGTYCEDCDIARAVPAGTTGLFGVMPWAVDPGYAERLWTLSEQLTGVGLADQRAPNSLKQPKPGGSGTPKRNRDS
jgi:NAD(P)-dependent dehydrogenase (short-subunit alcohol dehydrogenase family)